jgi:mannose-6-phosphate isomerase-like protein (cupin superfamily)
MESSPFAEALLPTRHDAIAPDGSQVRLLVRLPGGSMAHFELGPGEVSRSTQHRTVSEAWYILQGLGRMWRRQDGTEREIDLRPGTALTIPVGMAFQFRNTGREPLAAVGVTMPPCPARMRRWTLLVLGRHSSRPSDAASQRFCSQPWRGDSASQNTSVRVRTASPLCGPALAQVAADRQG